jgi:hypothetical protein
MLYEAHYIGSFTLAELTEFERSRTERQVFTSNNIETENQLMAVLTSEDIVF